MGYVPRFSRRDGGGYDAAYGKGGNKITAVLQEVEGLWTVIDGFGADCTPQKKLGALKEEWGAKAAASYGTPEEGMLLPSESDSQTSPTPAAAPEGKKCGRPLPPPLKPKAGPPRLGPPPLKAVAPAPPPEPIEEPAAEEVAEEQPPQGEVCEQCHQQKTGWRQGKGGKMIPPCHCDFPNTEEYEPDPFDPLMWADKDGGKVLSPLGALDVVLHWMLRNREYVTTEGKLDPVWADVQATLFRGTEYAHYRLERFA